MEKIFDFQIRLPEPDPWQRQRFIEKMAKERVPFALPVPNDLDLPASPRKLKALIRHVMLYQNEASRYIREDNEIDWSTVWYLEVVRQTLPKIVPEFIKWALELLAKWDRTS